MKFTCSITATAHYGTRQDKVVLVSSPSEVAWHLVLKILGYILFMDYEPVIEKGIGWKYKPDLVSVQPDGTIRLWVDCGNIAVRKIERVAIRVNGQGYFHILRRNEREALNLIQLMGKRIRKGAVRVWWFEEEFVNQLAEALDSNNTILCSVGEHAMELTMSNRNGEINLSSKIQSLAHGDPAAINRM